MLESSSVCSPKFGPCMADPEFKPIYDDSLEDDMMQDYLARRIEQQQAQRLRQYKKMLGHTTYGSELRQNAGLTLNTPLQKAHSSSERSLLAKYLSSNLKSISYPPEQGSLQEDTQAEVEESDDAGDQTPRTLLGENMLLSRSSRSLPVGLSKPVDWVEAMKDIERMRSLKIK